MPLISALMLSLAAQGNPIDLNEANYEAWRAKAALTKSELAVYRLPWEASLSTALRRAIRERKPLIVWIEKGDPLAMCGSHGIQMRNQALASDAVQRLAGQAVWVAVPGDLSALTPAGSSLLKSFAGFEGLVVFSPRLDVLARIGSTDSLEVSSQLSRAMIKSGATTPADARSWLEDVAPLPSDTLRLGIVARDVDPPKSGPEWMRKAWNGGILDLKPSDVAALLPSPLEPGFVQKAPAEFARRIARFVLVDSVRGIPMPFADDSVQVCELKSWVIADDAKVASVRMQGHFTTSEVGEWSLDGAASSDVTMQNRGMEANFLARLRVDKATNKLTAFEFVALGSRWGGSPLNGRATDLGPARIVFFGDMAADPKFRLARWSLR